MTQISTEHLVQEYAPMVRSLALRLAARLPANVEVDDLIQAGMMGLMDAAQRYKQQVGAQFSSYANTRINGAMMDELRRQDWLPRSVRAHSRKLEDATIAAEHRLGRKPSESEIAQELDLTVDEYHKLLDAARGIQIMHYESFTPGANSHDPGADDFDVIDHIAAENEDPFATMEVAAFKKLLIEAIEDLPERERLILSLIYEHDLNLKEVGEIVKLTQGRVSQIRTQALLRIRSALKAAHFEQLPSAISSYI